MSCLLARVGPKKGAAKPRAQYLGGALVGNGRSDVGLARPRAMYANDLVVGTERAEHVQGNASK